MDFGNDRIKTKCTCTDCANCKDLEKAIYSLLVDIHSGSFCEEVVDSTIKKLSHAAEFLRVYNKFMYDDPDRHASAYFEEVDAVAQLVAEDDVFPDTVQLLAMQVGCDYMTASNMLCETKGDLLESVFNLVSSTFVLVFDKEFVRVHTARKGGVTTKYRTDGDMYRHFLSMCHARRPRHHVVIVPKHFDYELRLDIPLEAPMFSSKYLDRIAGLSQPSKVKFYEGYPTFARFAAVLWVYLTRRLSSISNSVSILNELYSECQTILESDYRSVSILFREMFYFYSKHDVCFSPGYVSLLESGQECCKQGYE